MPLAFASQGELRVPGGGEGVEEKARDSDIFWSHTHRGWEGPTAHAGFLSHTQEHQGQGGQGITGGTSWASIPPPPSLVTGATPLLLLLQGRAWGYLSL